MKMIILMLLTAIAAHAVPLQGLQTAGQARAASAKAWVPNPPRDFNAEALDEIKKAIEAGIKRGRYYSDPVFLDEEICDVKKITDLIKSYGYVVTVDQGPAWVKITIFWGSR